MRPSSLFAAALAAATLAALLWSGRFVAPSRAPLRMVVWGMPFEDRLFNDVYARGFQARHPGCEVDYQRFSDVRTKYNAWATRASGPEIMRIEITWYPGFVRRGLLEPLSKYIRDPSRGLSPAQRAKFPRHLMELVEQEGETFALPQDNAQAGLFYNLDAFDAWNQQHPEDPVRYPDSDWTWETLRSVARKLTLRAPTGELLLAGFDAPIWSWTFFAFFLQAGGSVWSTDGRQCLVNSPPGVEALSFLRELQRTDRSFQPTLTGYLAGVGADTLFASGRTAMYMDGCWRVPNFDSSAPGLRYAVAPLPRGTRSAIPAGCCLWAISAFANRKDDAWEFLKWLVNDEQAQAYWNSLRVAPPANLGVINSDAMRTASGIPRDPTNLAAGYDVPPLRDGDYELKVAWLTGGFTPDRQSGRSPAFVHVHEFASDLQDELSRMLNEFLKPESTLTPQQALDEVVRNVEAVMSRAQR